MKRIISCFLKFALLVKQLFISGVSRSTSNPNSNNLELSIIIPPVICKPVSFPVIAVVTNNKANGKILVNNAKWRWGNQVYRSVLNEEIEARGDSLLNVNQLRSKKNSLTDAERETLSTNYERLKKSSKYLRFIVNDDMAKEISTKGSLKLSLKLHGKNLADKKSISICKKVTVKLSLTPQSPPIPPDANHSNWYFGDTHSHSTNTWDYYIGNGIYTIPELKSLATVAGLNWLTLTDHAYCLDSDKFINAKNTVTSLSDNTFAFLYGEELSCAELVNNSKAYNTCHCNGIMNNTFVPSTTDIFREASSPDSQQGINNLKQYGGLVTINHANWGTGLLEAWNFDINTYPYTHGETGMEIMNGGWSDLNNGSTTRWVDQRLLKGEKVFPFAGSDTESSNHFGECCTVVYADYLTQTDIKDNLEQGHQYVTTYPGLAIWARQAENSIWTWMGDTLTMVSETAEINLSYADSADGLNIYVMKGKEDILSEHALQQLLWFRPKTPFIMTSPLGGMAHGNYLFRYQTGEEVFQAMAIADNTAYTEFGCLGPSPVEYLRTFIPEAELFPPKPGTAWEDRHAFGAWVGETWLLPKVIEDYFGPCDTLEKLIEGGELLQCEGYKCIFEEARRQKPRCSMALNWCFNEPWPMAANNSIINWPAKPKPSYEAVKAACREVLGSARISKFSWKEGEIFNPEIWILNDSPNIVPAGTLEVYLKLEAGEFLLLRWDYPELSPNKNLLGPIIRFALPASSGNKMQLVLKCAQTIDMSSTYTLLYQAEKQTMKMYSPMLNL